MQQTIYQLLDELQAQFPEFFAVPGTSGGSPPRLEWFTEKLLECDRNRVRYVEMYRAAMAYWGRADRPPLPWEPSIYQPPQEFAPGDEQDWRDNLSVATKTGAGNRVSSFSIKLDPGAHPQ